MKNVVFVWTVCVLCLSAAIARAQVNEDQPPWLERSYIQTPIDGLWVRRTGDLNVRLQRITTIAATGGLEEALTGGTTCTWNLPPRTARLLQRQGIPVRRPPSDDVAPSPSCDLIIDPKFDLGVFAALRPVEPEPERQPPNRPEQVENDLPVLRFLSSGRAEEEFDNDTYTSKWATAVIMVEVRDRNGVVRAEVDHLGRVQEMQAVSRTADNRLVRFTATLRRTDDYTDTFAVVRAQDRLGDWSHPIRARLELVPHCGPELPVSNPEVQQLQENLACIGVLPTNEADGKSGPLTCEAIRQHMGDTAYAAFNRRTDDAGAWRRLLLSAREACAEASEPPAPVEPPEPTPLEPDSPDEGTGATAGGQPPESPVPATDNTLVWIAGGVGALLLFTMIRGVPSRPVSNNRTPQPVTVRVTARADPAPSVNVLPGALPGFGWRVAPDPAPTIVMSEATP